MDKQSEFRSFPTIYCRKTRVDNHFIIFKKTFPRVLSKGPIVYYVPGGGGGFRKVWCIKTLPPPKKKKKIIIIIIITHENCIPSLQPLLDQAVCALGSLSIMGGIQNLIICVKMARSERLAGSDCGDEYSLNTL